MLRAAWAAIGRKLLTFEKKLALGPIAFRRAQPAVASRQVIRHIIAEVAGCCWRQSRRHAFGASHREPRHPETFRNLARQTGNPALAPEIGRMFNGRDHDDHQFASQDRKPMAEGRFPLALLATIPGEGRAG